MNSLRNEVAGDEAFLYALYATTRQEELDAVGLIGPVRAAFLQHQFHAMTAGYAQAYPEASRCIIEHQGAPAGYLIVQRTTDEHRLVNIALRPEFQGRGIGSELIRRIQREAATAGVPVRLQVFENNRARSLYRRLGFVETETNGLRVLMEWSNSEVKGP